MLGWKDCTNGLACGDAAAASEAKGVDVPDVGLESPIIPIAGEDGLAFSTSAARLALSLTALDFPFLAALSPGVAGAGDPAALFRFLSSFDGPAFVLSGRGVRESMSKGETKSNMVLDGVGDSIIGVADFSRAEILGGAAGSPLSDAAISSRDCRAVGAGEESGWGEGASICVGDMSLARSEAEADAGDAIEFVDVGGVGAGGAAAAGGSGERAGEFDGEAGFSSDCCSKARSEIPETCAAGAGTAGGEIAAAAGAGTEFDPKSRSRSLGAVGGAGGTAGPRSIESSCEASIPERAEQGRKKMRSSETNSDFCTDPNRSRNSLNALNR